MHKIKWSASARQLIEVRGLRASLKYSAAARKIKLPVSTWKRSLMILKQLISMQIMQYLTSKRAPKSNIASR